MRKGYKIVLAILVALWGVGLLALLINGTNVAVLNTEGTIANQQRELIIFASALSLIVVIPVFAMMFFIAWKYRVSNKKAKYHPNWDHSKVAETIWWGVPILLIVILAAVAFVSSHELDPYKPLVSDKKPIKVQVVALNWKWLFIYPEQNIATVNYVQFPANTPVNFEITSDAPMNSFWIPQLGGQVYAMAGMTSELHLMADGIGSYKGSSANLSGEGFSGMKFTAESTSQHDFETWAQSVKQSSKKLSLDTYNDLSKPSKNNSATSYALQKKDLFDTVIMKYMAPTSEDETQHGGGHE